MEVDIIKGYITKIFLFTIISLFLFLTVFKNNSDKVLAKSNDFVGSIKIDNIIDEVLVQGSDNEFYLNHNIYKEKDNDGSIFVDYRIKKNNLNKIIVYGHNSNDDDLPFSNLEKYMDENFYNDNKYINIDIYGRNYLYQIFSVYVETDNLYYTRLSFDDKKDYYNHLIKLKNNSLYDTGVEVENDDKIIILQTCSKNTAYSKYNKKYLLVIGKLIK